MCIQATNYQTPLGQRNCVQSIFISLHTNSFKRYLSFVEEELKSEPSNRVKWPVSPAGNTNTDKLVYSAAVCGLTAFGAVTCPATHCDIELLCNSAARKTTAPNPEYSSNC